MSPKQRMVSLLAAFEAAGAQVVDPPILLPAETLLDLYGEDIRNRAYVITDALRGEQMLRPDFTVPVVQMHMAAGTGAVRYAYAGKVFRRQDTDPDRPNECVQVGCELFDTGDPAVADAEIYALIAQALAPFGLRAATGDIGILRAAVAGLETSAARKAALMRHLWRPKRFRMLLDRFGGRLPSVPDRDDIPTDGKVHVNDAPLIGMRSQAEIDARLAALREDAQIPPIAGTVLKGLDALLSVRETLPFALERLEDIAVDLPAIAPAVERLATRVAAMAARGIDVETLGFEASYGRTSMEYYDGFVFGFYAPERPDLQALASGGRYDALTARLGGGRAVPAVGGVLRPDLIARLEAER